MTIKCTFTFKQTTLGEIQQETTINAKGISADINTVKALVYEEYQKWVLSLNSGTCSYVVTEI